MGTYRLLEACRSHEVRLHHVSTDEVYGDLALDDPARIPGVSPYRPSSPYASTKARSDMLVCAWSRTFDLRATISNCSNNFGPHQHVEKFISRQVTNVLRDWRPRSTATGTTCAAGFTLTITRASYGRTSRAGALARLITSALTASATTSPCCVTSGGDGRPRGRLRLDTRPSRRRPQVRDRHLQAGWELGWEPRHVDFAMGLEATIEWYCRNEAGGVSPRMQPRRYAELGL